MFSKGDKVTFATTGYQQRRRVEGRIVGTCISAYTGQTVYIVKDAKYDYIHYAVARNNPTLEGTEE